MSQHYFEPERESDPHALPDLEVFYAGWAELTPTEDLERGAEPNPPGWYWWSCFPGCLPLSDAEGPYDTEDEALEAARMQYAWANDGCVPDAGDWVER